MDKLKKTRGIQRSTITKLLTKVTTELDKDQADRDLDVLRRSNRRLDELKEKLVELDEQLLEAMVDANATDAQTTLETDAVEEFVDKVVKIQDSIKKLVIAQRPNSPSAGDGKKAYRLPKVEVKTFNGDILEWLSWWHQFERIHVDKDLHDADKFQYLTQAIEEKSKAAELIRVYPQTGANYPKAVQALQDRFGKAKILKRVYVRELLNMIIRNSRETAKITTTYDKLEAHLKALESLGVSPDQMDVILFPMVESCLPEEILTAWQRSPNYGREDKAANPPKNEFDFLLEFVKQEVENENQREMARTAFGNVKDKTTSHRKERKEVATASSLSNVDTGCIFCGRGNHGATDCYKAKNMTMEAKRESAKKNRACFRCLKRGHMGNKCHSKIVCSQCNGLHPIIMCPSQGAGGSTEQVDPSSSTVATNSNQSSRGSLVLMKTLHVRVRGTNGKSKEVRLLFDEGSQRSYIKKSVAKDLECLALEELILQNSLFGGTVTKQKSHRSYQVNVEGLRNTEKRQFTLIDEDIICGSCPTVPKGPWMQELWHQKIFLTDTWANSSEVEILIGSDLWGKLMTGRMKQLNCGLTAVESVFGWTLSGVVPSQMESSCAVSIITMTTMCEKSIQDMCSLETIGIRDKAEAIAKEDHDQLVKVELQKNISRGLDGRYMVKLPWINEGTILPTNRRVAEKRLLNATSKLNQENEFKTYDTIFRDWEVEGIIEVKGEDQDTGHYLPHRPVFKPESLTTPVRPVFDASCRVGRNPSLNQSLEKGPNMLELIPSILLRFREKRIGVIADLRKAFQMVGVAAEDRNYQKFLWWEDELQQKMKVYQHCRVVFGLTCSPFILAAVLDHHLSQYPTEDKEMIDQLKKSLYVDNVVTSVDLEEEFRILQTRSVAIFHEAKMELRCWESNSKSSRELGTTNVLGMKWDKLQDTLSCHIPEIQAEEKITKRKVLSAVSQVFDPLGFTCPATLQPKLCLQNSWAVSLDWDKEWDEQESGKFRRWIEELPELGKIQIPRDFGGSSRGAVQIHQFCDASRSAYATVVFIRIANGDKVSVQLLQAKSRLTPLDKKKSNSLTIPRAELMGCLLGARLAQTTKESLNMEDVPTFHWTDSTIALAWIRRDEDWGTFVGNRVREINRLTRPLQWRHVPGTLNPADLPSRGCSPAELVESRWWEGPEWLYEAQENWPNPTAELDEEEVSRERKKTTTMATTVSSTPRFSSYMQNVRVCTWIRRFISNCRLKDGDRIRRVKTQFLRLDELQVGEKDLIKEVQLRSFQKTLSMKVLKVKLESDDLIHVETRINTLEDSRLFKSPVLLPKDDPIVHQLIMYVHKANGHAGAQFVLGKLREKYWILQGRKTVSRVINKCVVCRRHNAKSFQCSPADLPKNRIQAQFCFQTTGVDLAGPLVLKGGRKAWIVIYTCAVYRGVYLDVVNSISSEEFIDSLEKFTWTIGRPKTIYSDNGTNFVGTQNLMKKVDLKKFHVEKINWILNPPSAPWWGGWWERLVRTLKELLRKMIGTAKLTQKELEKCLASISYTINNRPLTTVTEDPEDLTPLTPAMFMRDLPVAGLPEAEEVHANHLRESYEKVRSLRKALDNRFRKEYLSQIVQRKNEEPKREPRVGDVVLVGAENKKRFEWPLGRILELIPGKDMKVRVARVKTMNGVLLRPLQRLYPLEVSDPVSLPLRPEVSRIIEKKEEVHVESREELPTVQKKTRSGRIVREPIRYTSWNK